MELTSDSVGSGKSFPLVFNERKDYVSVVIRANIWEEK
jgi:hypothetical protein